MYKQLLVVPLFLLLVVPFVSSAQTGGSVAVCPLCDLDPKSPPVTPCPPCKTQTGFGICMPPGGPNACKSLGVTQGDGSQDMAGAGGAEKMAEMASKIMEQLGQKKPSGGGPSGGGGSPSGSGEQQKPSSVNDILNGLYNADPIKVGSAVDQITDLLENTATGTSASTTLESVAQILTSIASTPVGEGGQNSSDSIVNSNPIESVGEATRSLISRIFRGRTENTEGDTVHAGTVQGETGIGAFFGRLFGSSSANEAPRFFTRLCTDRPWQASIISSIFSPAFFDTLCVRNGVVGASTREETSGTSYTGMASLECTPRVQKGEEATLTWSCGNATHSGAVGFTTGGQTDGSATITPTETYTYELQCNTGSRASCTIVVGEPQANIEASPFSVDLGGRARLYWTSEGVDSCEITGAGMQETGLSGAATTPGIYDTTEFTISCTTPDGEVVEDTVVVDVGL